MVLFPLWEYQEKLCPNFIQLVYWWLKSYTHYTFNPTSFSSDEPRPRCHKKRTLHMGTFNTGTITTNDKSTTLEQNINLLSSFSWITKRPFSKSILDDFLWSYDFYLVLYIVFLSFLVPHHGKFPANPKLTLISLFIYIDYDLHTFHDRFYLWTPRIFLCLFHFHFCFIAYFAVYNFLFISISVLVKSSNIFQTVLC